MASSDFFSKSLRLCLVLENARKKKKITMENHFLSLDDMKNKKEIK